MANKNAIPDLDVVPANNDNFNGTSVLGTGLVSTADDSFRNLASFLKQQENDLGGINTVTGTANAPTVTLAANPTAIVDGYRFVFNAVGANTTAVTLTLKNSATSTIATAEIKKWVAGVATSLSANDIAGASSLVEVIYDSAATAFMIPVSAGAFAFPDQATVTYTYTDAGATVGPALKLRRLSASPAVNDIGPELSFDDKDSAGNDQQYAHAQMVIVDPTSTTERAALNIYTTQNGSDNLSLAIGATGTASTATAGGTTTLTKLSAPVQKFTGTLAQTCVLPVVAELFIGQPYKIINESTLGAVTVQSSGANAIFALPPSSSAVFTSNANSGTGATVWDVSDIAAVGLGYQCRAWVNFNGTGTVAIRGSGNVSSITDNGTGDYTVNFTTAMPDANYAALITVGGTAGAVGAVTIEQTTARTASLFRFNVFNSSFSNVDVAQISVSVFR